MKNVKTLYLFVKKRSKRTFDPPKFRHRPTIKETFSVNVLDFGVFQKDSLTTNTL